MNLYVFEKSKDFILPTSYDRDEKTVTGIFTTSSVRFYKKSIEGIITYQIIQEKHPEMSPKSIRNLLRRFYSILEPFYVDEGGKVKMSVESTEYKRRFKFSKGMILVKGDNFIDVTNKELLHEYLSLYGFDEENESLLLKNKVTTLHRNPNKKLMYYFK